MTTTQRNVRFTPKADIVQSVAMSALYQKQTFGLLLHRHENFWGMEMSNSYAVVSGLIFALVAVGHVVRLVNQWTVQIGPYNVSMNVSWAALVVSALIAIWGFTQVSSRRAGAA